MVLAKHVALLRIFCRPARRGGIQNNRIAAYSLILALNVSGSLTYAWDDGFA